MDTDKITAERLASWRWQLKRENATPMVMVGVGHGPKSGQVILCLPEGVDDQLLLGALNLAIEAVRAGAVPQKQGESSTYESGRNYG